MCFEYIKTTIFSVCISCNLSVFHVFCQYFMLSVCISCFLSVFHVICLYFKLSVCISSYLSVFHVICLYFMLSVMCLLSVMPMFTIYISVSTICKSVSTIYVCVYYLYVCVYYLYVCVYYLYVCVYSLYVCVLPEATSMVWETSSGILWFNQTRLNFSYLNTGSKLHKSGTIVQGYPQRMSLQRRLYGFCPFSCIQGSLKTKIDLFLC